MRRDDKQLARPEVPYTNTRANIEATPSPVKGMVACASDENQLVFYSGSAWVALAAAESSTDTAAIHDNVDGEIHAITEETTPADDDELIMESAANGYAKRRVKKSNVGGTAAGTSTATANFDGNLSTADDTVQKALETLDELVGGPTINIFKAYLNTTHTPQNSASESKVANWTELVDTDSKFDAANSKWTPAAGKVVIHVTIETSNTNGNGICVLIYKNGTRQVKALHRLGTGYNHSMSVDLIDTADGDDYYEIYSWRWDAGTFNGGDGTATFWQGISYS